MADRSYLTWPFFSESHRRISAEILAWCQGQLKAEAEGDEDTLARHYVKVLGQAGILKRSVIAPYGGEAERLDVRSLCLSREIIAYHSALCDFSYAMQGLSSGPISLFGSEALKKKYLPGVAAGKLIAAFALSEAEAGSDVSALGCTAVKDGKSYVLNGAKTWISNGGIADFYVVFVKTGEAPGAKGLSAIVVEAGTKGFTVPERIKITSPHPLGSLAFNDCRVPVENIVGNPGEGFKIAMSTLDVFRPTVGAAALGMARRALDEALKYSSDRDLFGQKLSEFQLTQGKVAEMATDIDAAALLVYRAAWQKDSGAERITREAAMAKMYATEMAQGVIDKAVQLFGGAGVVANNIVERLYRDIRPLRIYEGTTEIQKLIIARQLFGESK